MQNDWKKFVDNVLRSDAPQQAASWGCAGDAIEEVAAFEEAAKDLGVVGVDPFAAGLDGVPARDDRKVVFQLKAPDELVDVRRQKKRIAEPERRREPHRGVGRHRRWRGGSRTILAGVGEVELVQPAGPHRAEQVEVQHVDFRRPFDAVG